MRTTRVSILGTWALLAAWRALADGVFIPSWYESEAQRPSAAAQRGVLIREGGDEVLLLETTYHGPSRAFAWVVPVPTVPSEVFEAEPFFIDEVFDHTTPQVVTRVHRHEPPVGKEATKAGIPTSSAMDAPEPADVTVHSRSRTGDYDAAVLSATGTGALLDWLSANGYQVSNQADESLRPYVDHDFAFVAVRLLDDVAERKPLLTDAPPLGIRFQTSKLFFPLGVSRGSAPTMTAILLCVIDEGPVDCDTVPTQWLSARPERLPRGQSYADLRRLRCGTPKRPALICEYSAQGPTDYRDLSYRADDWNREPHNPKVWQMHATRFFCLMHRDAMRDLEFSPAPTRPNDYRVIVLREGTSSKAAYAVNAAYTPALLTLGQNAPEGLDSAEFAALAARAARPVSPSAGVLLVGALVVLGLVAAGLIMRRKLLGLGALVSLVALAVAAGMGPAGGGGKGDEAEPSLILAKVATAVQEFRKETGVYPATLEDLVAAKQPAEGLDPSGNAVPLMEGWKGPYLSHLPADPLGVALKYDPIGLEIVDSAGFRVTIAGTDAREAQHMIDRLYGRKISTGDPVLRSPSLFWGALKRETGSAEHADYSRWLAEASRGALRVAWTEQVHGYAGYYYPGSRAIVYDAARGEAYALRASPSSRLSDLGAWFDISILGAGNRSARATVIRKTDAESQGAPATRRPLEGAYEALAVSADGELVALRPHLNRGLSILRTSTSELVPVTPDACFRADFGPDGECLYVLGSAPGTPVDFAGDIWLAAPNTPAVLMRASLDQRGVEVMSEGLGNQVLSVGDMYAAVTDVDGALRAVPLHDGDSWRFDTTDGHIVVQALARGTNLLWATVPATRSRAGPTGPGHVYACSLSAPSPEPIFVCEFDTRSDPQIALVDVSEGRAVVGWNGRPYRHEGDDVWVVKDIALSGGAPRIIPTKEYDTGQSGHKSPPPEPSSGPNLP